MLLFYAPSPATVKGAVWLLLVGSWTSPQHANVHQGRFCLLSHSVSSAPFSLARAEHVCWSKVWGRYHGGRPLSSDDSFHSPTVIPPSALDKPSIMKRYHRRRTCSHTSRRRSPTMVTLHDTRLVECRWWNDGWTVKTVVTWRWSASMIPAPDHGVDHIRWSRLCTPTPTPLHPPTPQPSFELWKQEKGDSCILIGASFIRTAVAKTATMSPSLFFCYQKRCAQHRSRRVVARFARPFSRPCVFHVLFCSKRRTQLTGYSDWQAAWTCRLYEPLHWDISGSLFVGWLLNVPATCKCISGTDLLRQFYMLPHWDRSCRSNFPSNSVTVC